MTDGTQGDTKSNPEGEVRVDPKGDEASRLWSTYTATKDAKEGSRRPWLGVALALGLFILLSGLYIVAFK